MGAGGGASEGTAGRTAKGARLLQVPVGERARTVEDAGVCVYVCAHASSDVIIYD